MREKKTFAVSSVLTDYCCLAALPCQLMPARGGFFLLRNRQFRYYREAVRLARLLSKSVNRFLFCPVEQDLNDITQRRTARLHFFSGPMILRRILPATPGLILLQVPTRVSIAAKPPTPQALSNQVLRPTRPAANHLSFRPYTSGPRFPRKVEKRHPETQAGASMELDLLFLGHWPPKMEEPCMAVLSDHPQVR
jgi:hypothetical protein